MQVYDRLNSSPKGPGLDQVRKQPALQKANKVCITVHTLCQVPAM